MWRWIFWPAGWIRRNRYFSVNQTSQKVLNKAWMLTTLTPMGLLERAHSYKDKKARLAKGDVELVKHGIFAYPVLMAADILIYDSNVVPVGRDQKQHVEMTRDIATRVQ